MSSPFDSVRSDPTAYQYLLNCDPRKHPWLRFGWSPTQIAQAQRIEIAEQRKMRGAGDVVAKITGALGIKPCAPCKKRQAALNRWFSFR